MSSVEPMPVGGATEVAVRVLGGFTTQRKQKRDRDTCSGARSGSVLF